MTALDAPTRALVRLAAEIAVAGEGELRLAMARTVEAEVDPFWVEELLLQSYLFAGFPRALNAMREWRRASGRAAPADDPGADPSRASIWARDGERTCAVVYGAMYEKLRQNIRALHPALDSWMIVDGYGKVLSRPGLDLARRELCIVAVCAVARQDRQLHSHLLGALNAGASADQVEETVEIASTLLDGEAAAHTRSLWKRVRKET